MFDATQICVMIACTIIPFLWILKLKSNNAKLYVGLILFFFFFYAGIGGGLEEVNSHYWYYYLIYSSALSLGIWLTMEKDINTGRKETESKLIAFIDKYGRYIIITYFLCSIATLIYPEFKLFLLVNPPAPNIIDNFETRFYKDNIGLYQSVLRYIIELLKPFFFLSLFKYRKAPLKFFLLIAFQPYVIYCSSAYYGRSGIVMLMFIFTAMVYKWRPDLRKVMIIALTLILPFFIVFLVEYASLRQGSSLKPITLVVAIEELFLQETNYPLWFETILSRLFSFDFMLDYFKWLFTLPLPGFLKSNHLDYDQISELLRGINRYDYGFFLVLPGVVGESVYYFGRNLFWLHALIYGITAGGVFNFLKRHPQFDVLFLFVAFSLSYMINRGGTGAAYPFIFKHLLLFCAIMYLYSRADFFQISRRNQD